MLWKVRLSRPIPRVVSIVTQRKVLHCGRTGVLLSLLEVSHTLESLLTTALEQASLSILLQQALLVRIKHGLSVFELLLLQL